MIGGGSLFVCFNYREWKMQREKVDFLVAVGEKLCNMESGSTEMQKLEGLTDASNNVKSERNHRWDDVDEDFAETISEMVSERALHIVFHYTRYTRHNRIKMSRYVMDIKIAPSVNNRLSYIVFISFIHLS